MMITVIGFAVLGILFSVGALIDEVNENNPKGISIFCLSAAACCFCIIIAVAGAMLHAGVNP